MSELTRIDIDILSQLVNKELCEKDKCNESKQYLFDLRLLNRKLEELRFNLLNK